MKTITILSILAVGSAFAGEPVYDKNPIIPPAPTLYQWFAGGTAGYLIDNDENFYTGHVGFEFPEQLNGWDQSLYLEVGFVEFDHGYGSSQSSGSSISEGYDGYTDFEYYEEYGGRINLHMEIVPITINYKLEKQVTNILNAYVGAGIGVALMEADATVGGSKDSDDDTVLFAQLFAGVLYNVSPNLELYTGFRAIYFEHPEFNLYGETLRVDDFAVKNFDVSADIGARYNF